MFASPNLTDSIFEANGKVIKSDSTWWWIQMNTVASQLNKEKPDCWSHTA